MRADNSPAIIAAAQRRHELTRAKAIQALRELDRTGAAVTFEAVARAAGVSRSWLYAQPDIKTEIERLRHRTQHAPTPTIPAGQRASEQSLLSRLRATLEHNRSSSRRTSGSAANSHTLSASNAPPITPRRHAGPAHVAVR
jgi:hypothetical protein